MFLRHGIFELTESSVILCQNVLLRFISENTITVKSMTSHTQSHSSQQSSQDILRNSMYIFLKKKKIPKKFYIHLIEYKTQNIMCITYKTLAPHFKNNSSFYKLSTVVIHGHNSAARTAESEALW